MDVLISLPGWELAFITYFRDNNTEPLFIFYYMKLYYKYGCLQVLIVCVACFHIGLQRHNNALQVWMSLWPDRVWDLLSYRTSKAISHLSLICFHNNALQVWMSLWPNRVWGLLSYRTSKAIIFPKWGITNVDVLVFWYSQDYVFD